MVSMTSLWLVILAGGAASFVASMIVWMLLPHHRSDYSGLPNEDGTIETLRSQNLKPGFYNFPHCSSWDELKKPEMQKKFDDGPIGYMTIVPNGMPPMGRNMLMQFLYFVIAGVVIAYVVHLAVPAGAEYMAVFRIAAATGLLAYGFGVIPDAIWYGRPWSVVFKHLFDALLYALLTAALYAWLWPAAG